MTDGFSRGKGIALPIIGGLAALATPSLGDRAWWIVPPIMFLLLLGMMLVDRRRPVTFGWVLFIAAITGTLAAILKVL